MAGGADALKYGRLSHEERCFLLRGIGLAWSGSVVAGRGVHLFASPGRPSRWRAPASTGWPTTHSSATSPSPTRPSPRRRPRPDPLHLRHRTRQPVRGLPASAGPMEQGGSHRWRHSASPGSARLIRAPSGRQEARDRSDADRSPPRQALSPGPGRCASGQREISGCRRPGRAGSYQPSHDSTAAQRAFQMLTAAVPPQQFQNLAALVVRDRPQRSPHPLGGLADPPSSSCGRCSVAERFEESVSCRVAG